MCAWPTDLGDSIEVDNYYTKSDEESLRLRQKYALGIPNMFSSHAQPSHDVAK